MSVTVQCLTVLMSVTCHSTYSIHDVRACVCSAINPLVAASLNMHKVEAEEKRQAQLPSSWKPQLKLDKSMVAARQSAGAASTASDGHVISGISSFAFQVQISPSSSLTLD